MPIAMFLVRTPMDEFNSRGGALQGRRGTLIIVDADVPDPPSLQANPNPGNDGPAGTITVGNDRLLTLPASAGAIGSTTRFTTIERTQCYVMLRPNCPRTPQWRVFKEGAYTVAFEPGNPVVRNLYRGGRPPNYSGPVYHDGNCLRIRGAVTERERGILIHEAPHVGWLTGCISPRNHGNNEAELQSELNPRNNPVRNESHQAMLDIFALIGGQTGNLWVLDW
jgi:hypothetical protein